MIKKPIKSMIDFKKILIVTLVASLTFVFFSFYSPIINRLTRDYNLVVNNFSDIDLKNLTIETAQGDIILSFDAINDNKDIYKIPKNKVLSNEPYYIVYVNSGKAYSEELISFEEKYRFKKIIIGITASSTDEIDFRIFKKNIN